MTTPRFSSVECWRCGEEVTGYEHRVQFLFEDGERIQQGNSAVLSCGCEIFDYELEVNYVFEPHEASMIDVLQKDTVLKFFDSGKHNENWHADLFDKDEDL